MLNYFLQKKSALVLLSIKYDFIFTEIFIHKK